MCIGKIFEGELFLSVELTFILQTFSEKKKAFEDIEAELGVKNYKSFFYKYFTQNAFVRKNISKRAEPLKLWMWIINQIATSQSYTKIIWCININNLKQMNFMR